MSLILVRKLQLSSLKLVGDVIEILFSIILCFNRIHLNCVPENKSSKVSSFPSATFTPVLLGDSSLDLKDGIEDTLLT